MIIFLVMPVEILLLIMVNLFFYLEWIILDCIFAFNELLF